MVPLLLACAEPPEPEPDVTPDVVPWSAQRAPLEEISAGGLSWRRGIIHLHSVYSHDACDGVPMPDGVADETCLAHLRSGLCDTAMDFAFRTDHPAHAAEQPWDDFLLAREDDEVVDGIATRMRCPSGHEVLTMPGIEDELMPIGLARHVSEDPAENDTIYNGYDAGSIDAEIAAGGTVLQAHTEGRTIDELLERQALGQAGVEMFNLHAMVDPTKREEDLGIDPWSYLAGIAPFLDGSTDTPPDLAFLAFYEEQTVSIERWDALSAVAPSIGVAGTDAHENAFPNIASDGERLDSYRRMMGWFSNIALVSGDEPADVRAAVDAGRLFVAFEVLGTPTGFGVAYTVGGDVIEMGGSAAAGGELVVSCPTLAATSPRDGDDPEITVTIVKDGATWQTGCGAWTLDEPGVYRVRADILPNHLAGFLDEATEGLLREVPWLYSNAIRVGL